MLDYEAATIRELAAALAAGRVTAVELVDAGLERIREYDAVFAAVLHVNERARAEASRLDDELRRGASRGPLHGVPVLLKDNFDTADMPTTGGSVALRGTVPPDDAAVVRLLREAGAILLAKTNLHELASGITNTSSLGGQTRNPYDVNRYPGGSSGGTAAGVAAGYAPVGYGTDTCGSIRIPAAYNALYGLRPTHGLVNMDGVLPLSRSQDVAGPLARTVEDLALGLDAIVPAETAAAGVPRFVSVLRADALRGARIGVLDALFEGDDAESDVLDMVRAAALRLERLGAEVVPASVERLPELLERTSTIEHEFKFDLLDYLGATPGAPVHSLAEILDRRLHHPAVERKFRARNAPVARDTLAYREVLARRTRLREALLGAMDAARFDAVAYPVMRCRPARIGDPQPGETCQLSAATGTPAIAVPAGFTVDGLPVGLELLARPFDDARLVGYAYAIERASPPRRPPPLEQAAGATR